ncbi:glutamyl-tRNA reductase [Archaeoglobales archaeon]|nr:MAG: glutamyl-tRNA reductase [Archaeoglobales archaeon]
MEISCMVISHKKASIDVLEKVWQRDLRTAIEKLLSFNEISECAVLLTCNRVEFYVVGKDTIQTLERFSSQFGIKKDYIEYLKNDDCLRHILRVASGLDSMMVGEDQILGQVREYYHLSEGLGGVGEILSMVFKKAINTGRKVRNLTQINQGSISIGSAAVELAEEVLNGLDGKNVLLIGAGEMGSLVANAIANRKACTVLIANRTFKKAEELAKKIGGVAVKFDRLEKCLLDSDVVISATSAPHYIIRRDLLEGVMEKREDDRGILIIDIALPRDVEESVGEIPGVILHTIDDLRAISERNLKRRLEKIPQAEKIVEEEFLNLKNMLKELRANLAISLMYSSAEKIKREEILELYNKISARYEINESILPILEDFANSFIKKFLRVPTIRLRDAAKNGRPEIIEHVEYLFGGGEFVSSNKDEKTEKRPAKGHFQGS